MDRHEFTHAGLRLSYLDAGSTGRPLIALHAHWMEGATYRPLAGALAPEWRVLALDQRGHGDSDHASSYTVEDYLGDLDALVLHLALEGPLVVLGNSLGGVNAFHYAARQPDRVVGMIVEDIGVVIADGQGMARAWAGTFPTREALEAKLGERFAKSLGDSIRHVPEGWRMAFDPEDMVKSQHETSGDHWDTWLASTCPALLVRGVESHVTTREMLVEMATRRSRTQLIELPGGHVVHAESFGPFVDALRAFLRTL